MKRDDRIFVAGHRGMVGRAIVRALRSAGYDNLLLVPRDELDLREGNQVREFMAASRPEHVVLAAAKVGGIEANRRHPADFIADNLAIALNVIREAHEAGVPNLLFLGSSCIYPRECPQPMKEEYLLTGPLEPTNEPYAVAKIAGIKLCDAYRAQHDRRYFSAMPTNLYGPFDNFDLESSHVLPALLRKAVEAREAGASELTVWGSGRPRREFLHVDDLASACVRLLETPEPPPVVNVGVGEDLSIRELAELVCDVAGFDGNLTFDATRPDGTPRKLLACSLIRSLGWSARIPLREGVEQTLDWYLSHRGIH